MAESRIGALAREALTSYLTANLTGTDQIYDLKNSADKTAPNVGCGAENIEEDADLPGTGNYFLDLVVVVSTQANDEAASNTLELEVINLLEVEDLTTQLTDAASPFTVIGLAGSASLTDDQDQDCWKLVWRRRVYACASDL